MICLPTSVAVVPFDVSITLLLGSAICLLYLWLEKHYHGKSDKLYIL